MVGSKIASPAGFRDSRCAAERLPEIAGQGKEVRELDRAVTIDVPFFVRIDLLAESSPTGSGNPQTQRHRRRPNRPAGH